MIVVFLAKILNYKVYMDQIQPNPNGEQPAAVRFSSALLRNAMRHSAHQSIEQAQPAIQQGVQQAISHFVESSIHSSANLAQRAIQISAPNSVQPILPAVNNLIDFSAVGVNVSAQSSIEAVAEPSVDDSLERIERVVESSIDSSIDVAESVTAWVRSACHCDE